MTELLLCKPDFYTIDYEINPWMHRENKPDAKKAEAEWDAYYSLLKALGIKIHLIPPERGLPDMVFTANGGLVFGNSFIVSRFRYSERQGEAAHFEAWFNDAGFETFTLTGEGFFEGEGDALMFGDTLVAGFRFRSDISTHREIGDIIGRRVLSVELVNPEFYHLDTCFCPLDAETVFYYPDAFDDYGQKTLGHLAPKLIEVSKEDALNFCCNALILNKAVVMNHCSEKLKNKLESLGFDVHLLNFSEFIKAGGSAKCLTLYVRKEDSQAIDSE